MIYNVDAGIWEIDATELCIKVEVRGTMVTMGKRECLIPVWRGKGREGGGGGGGRSDLGTIGQTEREAKVAEDLSSFICPYFLENVICAI